MSSYAILLFFFCLGIIRMQNQLPLNIPNHLIKAEASSRFVLGKLDKITKTKKGYKSVLDKLALGNSLDSMFSVRAKVLVYFDSSYHHKVQYGDWYFLNSDLKYLEKNSNPYSFDYSQFLNKKGIYHSAYCKENDCIKLLASQKKDRQLLLNDLRDRCESIFSKHISDQDRLAIVTAMVLGNKSDLSNDQKDYFKNTGAIHVLAYCKYPIYISVQILTASWSYKADQIILYSGFNLVVCLDNRRGTCCNQGSNHV